MDNEMIKKVLPFEVKEVAPRTLEFIGSTEDKDREGDIIMASGWQLKNYKKNPVFLWGHSYDEPPIGKTVKVWPDDGKLKFHVQFAEKEEYEFADTIYKLYKGGYLRATSVGFMPIKSEPMEVKEDEMVFHQPTRYLKQELLELSGCPVPANPNALAEAKAKGLIKDFWRFMPEVEDMGKPYPHEHACRLRDPDDFQEGTFKRTEREHEGKRYSIIMGKLEGETTMTEQAYRYDKDVWTAGEASKHCKDHDGTFEAASGEAAANPANVKYYSMDDGDQIPVDEDKYLVAETESSESPQEKEISQVQIADEFDFMEIAVKSVGLNEQNKVTAWNLVRTIMRLSGDDIPVDIAEKIGAVLNRANREKLEKIKSLAQEVLDSAEKEPESDKGLSLEDVEQIITKSVTATIEKAQGKIRR